MLEVALDLSMMIYMKLMWKPNLPQDGAATSQILPDLSQAMLEGMQQMGGKWQVSIYHP